MPRNWRIYANVRATTLRFGGDRYRFCLRRFLHTVRLRLDSILLRFLCCGNRYVSARLAPATRLQQLHGHCRGGFREHPTCMAYHFPAGFVDIHSASSSAACALFIVPGVPLINFVDDMLDNYALQGGTHAGHQHFPHDCGPCRSA